MRKNNLSLCTFEYDGVKLAVYTPCNVYYPFSIDNVPEGIENAPEFTALWDTGASISAISKKVIDALGLEIEGSINVATVNGLEKSNTYLISLILPNNYIQADLTVCECHSSKHDVIVGMDIISKGDFAITNKDGKTKFTFQIPSTHDIDFEKE